MVLKEILWIWWHFSKSKQNKAGSFLMIQWIGFLAHETKSSGSRERKRKQVVNVSKKDSFLRSKGLVIRHEYQGISHLKFWKLWNSFLVFTISSELKEKIQVNFLQKIHLFFNVLEVLFCPRTKLLMKNSGRKKYNFKSSWNYIWFYTSWILY